MSVRVTKSAVRALVKEALGPSPLQCRDVEDETVEVVDVNPVVDPSAAVTDHEDVHFVPHSKPELVVALKQLANDIHIDDVPSAFQKIKDALGSADFENKKDSKMDNRTKKVEESVRKAIRKTLAEMNEAELPPVKKIPYGVHGDEYLRRFDAAKKSLHKSLKRGRWDDFETEEQDEEAGDEESKYPGRARRTYKSTAIGSMSDVSGASFDQIATELGFSVAGAKQAVDKALDKARWMAREIEPEELEIITLSAMSDYIKMLQKTGELSADEVKLMKDHPEIVRDLDGFREFLGTTLKRLRKASQKSDEKVEESKALRHAKLVEQALKLSKTLK